MRWIVDAMNVIGSRPDGWWRDRRGALSALVDHLETWVASVGEDVTVVLEKPPSPPLTSAVITVVWAPSAAPNSADDEIVRLVTADDHPDDLCVVTSDGLLERRVTAAGASINPAKKFRDLVDPR